MLLYNHKNKKKIRKLDNANVDVSLRSSHTLLVRGQAFARAVLLRHLVGLSYFHMGKAFDPSIPLLAIQPNDILRQIHKGEFMAA